MNLLAFESSTRLGGVALIQNGVCTYKKESLSQKSHSEVLHQYTFEILKEADLSLDQIDAFAAGIGPGSFTGIRVSVSTAKAFAYSLNKPLIAIDSLINLAHQNLKPGEKVLCLINAYKNMSYYGMYEYSEDSPKVLLKPSAIPMKDIKSILQGPVLTVGDGYTTYEKFLPDSIKALLLRSENTQDLPTAASLGELAAKSLKKGLTLDWKSLKPLYIRSSEAEENQRGIVWSPLDFKE